MPLERLGASRSVKEIDMDKPTCSIEGCDRPRKTRGWCHAHYMRWYERGEVGTGPIRPHGGNRICVVEGCSNPYESAGYCAPHRKRVLALGDPGPATIKPRTVSDEDATYETVHIRVKLQRGPARNYPCVSCGKQARDWAYDHTDPNERSDPNGSRPYSLDLDCYRAMCVPCHRAFDRPFAAARRRRASASAN